MRLNLPPVMIVLGVFAKRPERESERFFSDSVDTCIMASGNEGDDGLWVAKDICVGGGTGIDPETDIGNSSRYASVAA